MFESINSAVLKVEDIRYLAPIINYNSSDKTYYIYLLFKFQNLGIHCILCEKLKTFSLREDIPQLIEIMLKEIDNHVISHPIYGLLYSKAKVSPSFRIDLFLRLKSVLSTVDEAKASYCYFLCCDILEMDNLEYRRNLRGLHNRFRFSRTNAKKHMKSFRKRKMGYYLPSRTFSVCTKSRTPMFQGIMIFFVKSVVSILNSSLFYDFEKLSAAFNSKKRFKSLNFKSTETDFKTNIRFLERMVNVSNRLRFIPKTLRPKALQIELAMLNYDLKSKLQCSFDISKCIVNFLLDYSKTLDSAENCPYLVLVECVSSWTNPNMAMQKTLSNSRVRKSKILLSQLESLNDLGDIGDIDGIRESIIKAMENILFEKKSDNKQIIFESQKDTDQSKDSFFDCKENSTDKDDNKHRQINDENNFEEKHVLIDTGLNERKSSKSLIIFDNNSTEKTQNKPASQDVPEVVPDKTPKEKDFEQQPIVNNYDCYGDVYLCDSLNAEALINPSLSTFSKIKAKFSERSKFSHLPGWDLKSFIVKSGGVIKHEYIAHQILTQIKEIFMVEKLPIYVKNYKIILISDTSGLIETVQDATSIHRIKADGNIKTLLEYFNLNFLGYNFKQAKDNFLFSLVGYSLASYLLQIKDRHNGNILIDGFGHIVHVDFGFIFGKYPGIFSVENAPFKMSADYLDLINMDDFKKLFILGFKALRKHQEKLTRLVEIMEDTGYCDKFTFANFVERLKLSETEKDIEAYCQWMITKSTKNMGTIVYDQIQYFSNGYL